MADYTTTTFANARVNELEATRPPYSLSGASYRGEPVEGAVEPPTPTTTVYYKLQGYRYQHVPPDYETWVGTSVDTPNPSGQPIQDVAVVATWTE